MKIDERLRNIIAQLIETSEKRAEASSQAPVIRPLSDYVPSSETVACDTKLHQLLKSLTYEDIQKIEALMLFGRGDFDTMDESYGSICTEYPHENKAIAIDYICGKAPLHVYLKTALSYMDA